MPSLTSRIDTELLLLAERWRYTQRCWEPEQLADAKLIYDRATDRLLDARSSGRFLSCDDALAEAANGEWLP